MPKIRWFLIYAVLTFIIAVNVVTFFKEIGGIERMSGAVESQMSRLVDLTRRNQELEEKNAYLSTPEGMGDEAGTHFNMAMSGEKIYYYEIVSEDADLAGRTP